MCGIMSWTMTANTALILRLCCVEVYATPRLQCPALRFFSRLPITQLKTVNDTNTNTRRLRDELALRSLAPGNLDPGIRSFRLTLHFRSRQENRTDDSTRLSLCDHAKRFGNPGSRCLYVSARVECMFIRTKAAAWNLRLATTKHILARLSAARACMKKHNVLASRTDRPSGCRCTMHILAKRCGAGAL